MPPFSSFSFFNMFERKRLLDGFLFPVSSKTTCFCMFGFFFFFLSLLWPRLLYVFILCHNLKLPLLFKEENRGAYKSPLNHMLNKHTVQARSWEKQNDRNTYVDLLVRPRDNWERRKLHTATPLKWEECLLFFFLLSFFLFCTLAQESRSLGLSLLGFLLIKTLFTEGVPAIRAAEGSSL